MSRGAMESSLADSEEPHAHLIATNEDDEIEDVFKIVLVGDSGVGKTNILARAEKFAKGDKAPASDGRQRATVGVEFASLTFQVNDGCKVKAQIWDTAGQERYRAITRSHYRRAAGAMLVFDVTNPDSFENATKTWHTELVAASDDEEVMKQCTILVGNKTDLGGVVSLDDHKQASLSLGVPFIERTSAKLGHGVEAAFGKLIQRIYDTRRARRGALHQTPVYRKSFARPSNAAANKRAATNCC